MNKHLLLSMVAAVSVAGLCASQPSSQGSTPSQTAPIAVPALLSPHSSAATSPAQAADTLQTAGTPTAVSPVGSPAQAAATLEEAAPASPTTAQQ